MFSTVNECAFNRNALNRRTIGNGNSLYVNCLPALTTLVPDSPIDRCAMSSVRMVRLPFCALSAVRANAISNLGKYLRFRKQRDSKRNASPYGRLFHLIIVFLSLAYSLTRRDTLIPTEIKSSLSISRSRVGNVCPLTLPAPPATDTSHYFPYACRNNNENRTRQQSLPVICGRGHDRVLSVGRRKRKPGLCDIFFFLANPKSSTNARKGNKINYYRYKRKSLKKRFIELRSHDVWIVINGVIRIT